MATSVFTRKPVSIWKPVSAEKPVPNKKPLSAKKPRGSTLLEVLIAGAVLAIGVSGISLLIVQASKTLREGDRQAAAAEAGFGSVEELVAQGFGALAVGTYDAGTVLNHEGVPIFTRTVTISDLRTMDGGVPFDGFHIQMDVTWRDSLLHTRTQTYATIVTAPFDGGF